MEVVFRVCRVESLLVLVIGLEADGVSLGLVLLAVGSSLGHIHFSFFSKASRFLRIDSLSSRTTNDDYISQFSDLLWLLSPLRFCLRRDLFLICM